MGMPRTFLMSLLFATLLLDLAVATNYVVGGLNGGWDTNTDQATWASSQTFLVGDNPAMTYPKLPRQTMTPAKRLVLSKLTRVDPQSSLLHLLGKDTSFAVHLDIVLLE